METAISQLDKIRNFISEITFTDIDKLKEDTLLFEEGIFDSLGFLSLISYLNEEYDIEVENDELSEENFETIKAVAAFISRKKNLQEN
ncbi:MAG TPA: acyl carrier protein [Draconibacterium sp.]|nr:acyl carrier protein [Draconibacterium sp.]